MARPLRIDYPGALHHVIVKGNNGINIYYDDADRSKFLDIFRSLIERYKFKIYAYCLMDNHTHLLIETGNISLSRLMREFLTGYVQYFNRRWNRKGHLLGDRYKSILVDKSAYLLTLQRYIHLNPVKAKMVEHPINYRWSSYKDYMGLESSFVEVDTILSYFNNSRKDFERFTIEGMKLSYKLKPKKVQDYIVYGDENFVKNVLQKEKKERRSKRVKNITTEDVETFLKERYKFDIHTVKAWNRNKQISIASILLRERVHLIYRKISEILGISLLTVVRHSKGFGDTDRESLLEDFDKWLTERKE